MGLGLNDRELELLAGELGPLLSGTVLQEVRQTDDRQLRLSLRRPGLSFFLHLCVEPELPFAGLAPDHGSSRPGPDPLVLRLRSELTGALLVKLRKPEGQRVLELAFRTRGELGGADWVLEFRAFGARPAARLWRDGELLVAMPTGPQREARGTEAEKVRGAGTEAGAEAPGSEVWKKGPGAALEVCRFGDGGAAEAFRVFSGQLEAERLERRRANLGRALQRALDKTSRLTAKIAEDLEAAGQRLEAGHRADLLKSVLHQVKPGATRVMALDWTNEGAEVWLALDPKESPAKTLELLYRSFRKGKTALRVLTARLAEAQARGAQLEAALAALRGMGPEELNSLETLAGPERGRGRGEKAGQKRKPGPERALPWRVFASASGRELLVGRNAAGNAELTFREARPWDVWLHVRGAPGSHVVMRMAKGEELDQEALVDAAHLAAFYSDLRRDPSPEVIWAERRFLRSVKGQLGAVLVTREHVLQLRVDQARLERLGGK